MIGAMEDVRSGHGRERKSGERGFFLLVHIEGHDSLRRNVDLKIESRKPFRRGLGEYLRTSGL